MRSSIFSPNADGSLNASPAHIRLSADAQKRTIVNTTASSNWRADTIIVCF